MLDSKKLFKILTNDPELHDIPIVHIIQVTLSVVKALNSGQCIINNWED